MAASVPLASLIGSGARFRPGSDLGLALGVMCLLAILVLNLPPFLLD